MDENFDIKEEDIASNSGQWTYELNQTVPLFMVKDTIMGHGPRRRRGKTR